MGEPALSAAAQAGTARASARTARAAPRRALTTATPRRIAAALWLLLPPLFWAGNFILGRAMRDSVTPMTLSLGRWLIALLCLLPFACRALRREAPRHWTHRWLMLGCAVTGVAAFNSLIYLGLHTSDANNAVLFNALIPPY